MRRRLFVALLVVEFSILVAMLAVTIMLLRGLGTYILAPQIKVRALLLIQVIPVAVACAVAAVLFLWLTGIYSTRITRVTALVEEQVAAGNLNITLETDHEDEIGHLMTSINKLNRAYRHSLQGLSRRADELATLNLVAEMINRTLDLQEVFDTSLREALKTVDWDMGAIYMWDERIKSLNMVSYVGMSEGIVRELISYQLGEGITGQAAEKGEMIIIEDTRNNPRFTPPHALGMPVTQISIPLVTVPGQLLGVLNVANSVSKRLSEDEINLLTTVAHQISIAIDKAQLYTKVSEHAEALEGIVEARTKQLAQAIDELSVALERAQEADKVKSLLLSTVSHELRTPLATIKGNTSMLIQHQQQITADMLVEHLKDIEEETDKLTELISSLLEMSRIEAGILQIQPQQIDLVDVLRSTVNAAQVRIGGHPLHLNTPEKLPTCYGDARRIEQILANLLDNAAKYSPEGTLIEVRAENHETELIVSVVDQGRGIATEHLENIFDRFYQIDSNRDAGRGGIGLGLAICRGLVEAHGGRIWVTSQIDQGSTFSFSLPVASEQVLSEGKQI